MDQEQDEGDAGNTGGDASQHRHAVMPPVGRFAIFPSEAFSASEPDNAQSFGLELPQDALVHGPQMVSVSLEAAGQKARTRAWK